MKANVLIYKWVTLGKTWCGGVFFCYSTSPGSYLELTLTEACSAEAAPRGRLRQVKANAK